VTKEFTLMNTTIHLKETIRDVSMSITKSYSYLLSAKKSANMNCIGIVRISQSGAALVVAAVATTVS